MFYDVLLQGQLAWSTSWLAGLICIVFLYLYLFIRCTRPNRYKWQPLLFFLGVGLLYVTIGSPFSSISHLSFSLHMIQMSILYFIIPPLILLGIPDQLSQQLANMPKINSITNSLPRPRKVLYGFAVLFLIYHLPVVLNIVAQKTYLQNGYLFLLFILSFGMWWPIASPDPKQRLRHDRMKHYAFLSGMVLMPACVLFILTAFLNSGNNPFLTQLTVHLCIPPAQSDSFQLLPPPFNTKFDQMMAGFFMLGLHKFALVMTCKLEGRIPVR